ncbi:lytic transglycosylase domain-containing protein [Microbacterium album]|uniref:Murein transglycosylase n=1 Tax=Microbacterium album TaxID=2053191 RepID=A0A917IGW3_9MICO|nr:lytic murein transglycosylase [Microbacterium album]GGH47869.1 murein transglycosylase [Microbacterium album]
MTVRRILDLVLGAAGVLIVLVTAAGVLHLSRLDPAAERDRTPVTAYALRAEAPASADTAPAGGASPEDVPPSGTPAAGAHGVWRGSVDVSSDWLARVSAATDIPVRALAAYARADLAIDVEQPACGLDWNTLAAIGAIESGHGSHGGAVLGPDGRVEPEILGPVLDGNGVAAIRDTDDGAWDGDRTWDRAVGPMQFIPETWNRWGADANGDGIADPHQLDDAALAAARYLCASGPVDHPEGWRRAVFSYNHLDSYVDAVAELANRYAAAVR